MLTRPVATLGLAFVVALSLSSTAAAQVRETRKSVMRPKSIGANLQRRQRQTENRAEHQNGDIADHSHGAFDQPGHSPRHSIHSGFPLQFPVQPNYPYGVVYPYGYTLGNPGFNIPPYQQSTYPPYGYGSGYGNSYGYGYSNRYGYGGYGYPVYGSGFGYGYGSITRGTPPSPTPGSHYFGNPHASQYIPGTR
ncbi:MAG: hypothetical protein WBD31_11200 [Rubripirellula sp.]